MTLDIDDNDEILTFAPIMLSKPTIPAQSTRYHTNSSVVETEVPGNHRAIVEV